MTIYYFSATGNSLKAAIDIASAFEGATLIPIREKMPPIVSAGKTQVGFICPVYMGTLPEVVRKFLLSFPFRREDSYFMITTYYTYKGVALAVAEKIIRQQGGILNYSAAIATVGNCLMEYEVPASKREKRLKRATEQTGKIVEEIRKEIQTSPRRYSHALAKLHEKLFRYFFKEMATKFSLEPGCTGCGKCQRVCPAGNIVLVNKQPTWGDNCHACHACVHWCPQNAINIGKSKGRLQYHHPEIRYKQLLCGY